MRKYGIEELAAVTRLLLCVNSNLIEVINTESENYTNAKLVKEILFLDLLPVTISLLIYLIDNGIEKKYLDNFLKAQQDIIKGCELV